MYFNAYKSLYSDTLLPDIFITEYMPSLDGDYLKVYIYCLFLSKHDKRATTQEISKILGIDEKKVQDSFKYLESVGVMIMKENRVELADLKEKEIKKIYRIKTTSTPAEAVLSSERNKRRNDTITAINNTFFQGVMSPSWYTDIDAWFDRYKFDEDVMFALFNHCFEYRGLAKSYIVKVADNWYSKNIKNSFDLDNYSIEYQKFKDVRMKTVKKLKLNRNLTEYEEEYVEKWVLDYKYDFETIELALRKTTAKTNPNFKYVNSIITDWYNKGLRNKAEVEEYDRNKKTVSDKRQENGPVIPQRGNFEQRKHGDDYYDDLYEDGHK